MTEQIGVHKIKLAQERYKNGSFYVSFCLAGGQVKSLDGRFIIENGNHLTRTRNGFRIPMENLSNFRRALAGDLRNIGDITLFENNSFRFHVRYLHDKYGEGIDFRKYKTTSYYTGWDSSGIRMKLEDVIALRDWLAEFNSQMISIADDIFVGKIFEPKHHDNHENTEPGDIKISSTIQEILEG